jgi:signal transduction histidine kinase
MILMGVWLVLAAATAGLFRLTRLTIGADRHRAEIAANARHEQQLSLALWRMDTLLAPIIAREAARPWWTMISQGSNSEQDGVQTEVALRDPPEYVIYHFHWPLDGVPWSPQTGAPTLAQIEQLQRAVDARWLLSRLPQESFPGLSPWSTSDAASELASNWSPRNAMMNQSFFGGYGSNSNTAVKGANDPPPAGKTARGQSASPRRVKGEPQVSKDTSADDAMTLDNGEQFELSQVGNDIESRNLRYQVQAAQSYLQQREGNTDNTGQYGSLSDADNVAEGISQAVWAGRRLLLARRVKIGETVAIQGCELDWPRLKQELLAEAHGLLDADLVPIDTATLSSPSHLLAGLPVRLEAALPLDGLNDWTPIQTAWLIGWIAFVLAALALVGLFHGLISLSEKRASFVSAVTHELRTPLTTFRLYSQMLARDMVPRDARQQYLSSLCAEAERLSHLIDNVLTYARLERGRSRLDIQPIGVRELINRVAGRLAQRAEQAQMVFVVQFVPAAESHQVLADLSTVEQILFNLVDNAAKYAAAAQDRRIVARVDVEEDWLVMAIIDHGPGLSAQASRRLFQPFSKSTEQAAGSGPGVGLGLALCRRLARQVGGQLKLVSSNGDATPRPGDATARPAGCRMELRLRLVRSAG